MNATPAARAPRSTPAASGAPVLEARGLNKSFGAVSAASDVSVQFSTGSKVSLIGANGAGKTTFVNMVTGYLKPDTGAILLDGVDVTKKKPRAMTQLGVCRSFQIPQLCEPMTSVENLLVAFGASGRRFSLFRPCGSEGSEDEARAMLDRFGLSQYADRVVSELPGGVRKLLDIAMAMVRKPKVLLLDEPTSGVSADEKYPLMDTVMAALAHEDVTVLFVEHDLDIVTRYSDRVVAFYAGKIIADDLPDEVLSDDAVQKYVTGGPR
jgi:branched-chain amino acid transport system ATP-binding protein